MAGWWARLDWRWFVVRLARTRRPVSFWAWVVAFALPPLLVASFAPGPAAWVALALTPVAEAVALGLAVLLWKVPPKPLPAVLSDALHGQRTERVRLRRSHPRDVAAVVATIDGEVIATNGWPKGTVETVMKSIARAPGRLGAGALITDTGTGAVVGVINVVSLDEEAMTCEIGWWLGPGHRGRGYGTDAVRLVLPALHGAGIRRVRFGTRVDNVGVQRIGARVGAHPDGRSPHVLPDGTTIDSLWFVSEAAAPAG